MTEHENTDTADGDAPEPRSIANTVVGLAVFFMATVLVVGIAYVFAADVLSPDAPRSAVERELNRFDAAVAANPDDPEPHARYARALVSAGQYEEAEEILAAAVVAMPEEPLLLVEQARLAWARGDSDALARLENTYQLIETVRADYEKDLAERGIGGDITLPETDAYTQALLLEAAIYEAGEDWSMAIDAYTRMLTENPTAADALTARGEAYLALGDVASARLDFQAALEFIPDFEPALSGLDAAGGEQ